MAGLQKPPVSIGGDKEPVLKRTAGGADLTADNQKFKKQRKKNRKQKEVVFETTSPDGYLTFDVIELRKALDIAVDVKRSDDGTKFLLGPMGLPEFREVEVKIMRLSSTGDGVGVHEGMEGEKEIVVVPFALPGDVVTAKIYKKLASHSMADFVRLVSAGDSRDDSLVRCKYFSKCAGCQLQMMPYADQLQHKREVILRAYANFCDVAAGILPEIGNTIGSPLEYGYRTKLTPHFDVPRRGHVPNETPIGFTQKGRSFVLDIEECPIGTPAINEAYKSERTKVSEKIQTYKRGATLLFRESVFKDEGGVLKNSVCLDSKDIVTDYVNEYTFRYPAGDFFQCNSSVLPQVTEFVNSQLQMEYVNPEGTSLAPKHLVDAYCGSGLFSIACSKSVEEVIGVEISANSVKWATENAKDNAILNAQFVLGDAAVIFKKIRTPAKETSMILDPPRKGCDDNFLNQLLDYQPRRIVYVSCNVHTQARDLKYILTDPRGLKYTVDSIRGFDFFPQTHHVESVAVLTYHE
ncbi:S-adenosyl-L-methionine-dependent methyltransferase [Lipomyces arxii]|uniref:S-adenosyl-L-methionine-dependent methyltransferase n=1 Tax=Lipomyces arxii TaxID=56418 RepID=UPI0034CE15FF